MEFIFNICCLVAVFICLSAGIRFWKSYKKTGILQFKNFSLGFLLASLAFAILSLPKLILFDSFWVQIDFILVDLSILGTELFLIPATLSFSKTFIRFQKIFLWFIPSMIVIYVLLNIYLFTPAVPLFSDGIYYWKNGVFWLHSIIWVPLASGAGVIGGWFLLGIKKIKEKKLSRRSFFFGLTGVLVFIAGILFWYFKFFNPSSKILAISGIIGDLGFLFGVIGSFLYQPSRETLVKKIT